MGVGRCPTGKAGAMNRHQGMRLNRAEAWEVLCEQVEDAAIDLGVILDHREIRDLADECIAQNMTTESRVRAVVAEHIG
jgi:hypothetical protein